MAEPIGALRVAISMAAAQFEKDSAEIRSSVQRMEDRFQQMQQRVGKSSNQVSKELNKLTDSAELLGAGIRKVRNIVEGMVWGTILAGITAYAIKMFDSAQAAEELAKKTDGVISSLLGLSRQVNPSIKESEALTRANFELAKAKLFLAQASAKETVEELKATISRMESTHVIQRQSVAMMALKNLLEKGTPFVDLAKEEEAAKLKTEELRKQLTVLSEELKVQIPSWDAFKIMIQGVKEELVFDIKQPLDVMLAELEDFQAQLSQKTLTGPKFTTDPGTLEKEREKLRQHYQEMAQIERDFNQMRLDSHANTTSAIASITDALFTFSGQKSKALFRINKIANIANATMDAYAAANKAYNSLPYPFNVAAAASVLAAGLANVARIKSMTFGGGGGGGGGAAAVTSVPPTDRGLREPRTIQHPPLIVNVNGIVIGEDAFINERIIPGIEDAVRNERSKLAMKED